MVQIGDQVYASASGISSHTMEVSASLQTDEVAAYTQLATSVLACSNEDLDQLLEAIMDEVIDLTSAGKGFLLLQVGCLVVKTARNLNRETIQKETVEFSDIIRAKFWRPSSRSSSAMRSMIPSSVRAVQFYN